MRDWIYALRILRKQPAYTLAGVVALGLAIASNAAMFSAADALLFRPLDLARLDRLVHIYGGTEGTKFGDIEMSPADYYELQSGTASLASVAAYAWNGANLTGDGLPERVQGMSVTANFFELLGVEMLHGRMFRRGAEDLRTVVLAYDFWQRRYAGDPKVIGRRVELSGVPHEIIGVAPRRMKFPAVAEMWMPLEESPKVRYDRSNFRWTAIARLRDEVSFSQASAEVRAWGRKLAAAHPETHQGRGATVWPLRESISGAYVSDYTNMSLWTGGFLLLIACANVANLHFARVSGRVKELSVRQALGGSRWRVVRQLLTESVLLGVGGLAVGLVLGYWFIELIRAGMPAEVEKHLPGWRGMALSGWAFAYASAVALISSVAAGLAPAWQASGGKLIEALKDGARGGTKRSRLRGALVVAQVALSLILLVGGVLITRGTMALAEPSTRFRAAEALTFIADLPRDSYGMPSQREQFTSRLLERLRAMPGVAAVTTVTNLPYSDNWWTAALDYDGFAGRPGDRPVVHVQRVDEEFTRTMPVKLRAGRAIEASDAGGTQSVAMINERLARQAFGNGDPLGKRLRLDDDRHWATVVGVVEDYAHSWVQRGPQPTVFLAYRQNPAARVSLVLRPQSGDAFALAAGARRAVAEVDARLPVHALLRYDKVINDNLVG
ncbi:MAG: ABC transporter permease, partial [Bryobacteraceae bacterium]|nr:ABC transporter permease [Bryobacteraceae bacterium]